MGLCFNFPFALPVRPIVFSRCSQAPSASPLKVPAPSEGPWLLTDAEAHSDFKPLSTGAHALRGSMGAYRRRGKRKGPLLRLSREPLL